MFITFEGIEGAGKTTQLKKFVEELKSKDVKLCVTREPGGTEFGEAVREIILSPKYHGMNSISELYLLAAARCQHVTDVIKPALERGEIVVCDRYGDATRAYQVGGRGIDEEIVSGVHAWATGGVEPELTFLIDCSVEEGLSRAKKRSNLDRMEAEKIEFHKRVRNEYLNVARREPERVIVIDGSKDEEIVWNELLTKAKGRLKCLKV